MGNNLWKKAKLFKIGNLRIVLMQNLDIVSQSLNSSTSKILGS